MQFSGLTGPATTFVGPTVLPPADSVKLNDCPRIAVLPATLQTFNRLVYGSLTNRTTTALPVGTNTVALLAARLLTPAADGVI